MNQDIRNPLDVQIAKVADAALWLKSFKPLTDDEQQLVRFAIYDLAAVIDCEADIREKVNR